MTVEEFDERQETLACQRCGGGPLERYEIHQAGPLDGCEVVVCAACSGLLELLDVISL